jgi:CheY-like chemotaxis protein
VTDKPSVLYVEDDVAIAEMYTIGLGRAGYAVTIARTWPEARRILQDDRYDLVLLDIMLPGPDGMQALEEIRATPSLEGQLVAVLSNSELSPEVHSRARALGVLAWLTKSKYPPPQVARSIRRWLKNRDLTRGRLEA